MLMKPSPGVIVLVVVAEGVVEVLEEVVVGTLVVDLVGAVVVAVIVVAVVVLEVVVEDVEASTNPTWQHLELVSSDLFLLQPSGSLVYASALLVFLTVCRLILCRKENQIQR